MNTSLILIHCRDGGGETTIGRCDTMTEAHAMAAAYERGEIEGLPEHLYGSARALDHSGTNEGLIVPEIGEDADPIAWIGDGGYIAVFAERA